MNILWADDHVNGTLTTTVSYLEHQGINIAKAENASQAFACLRTSEFDGVLLDVKFPGESGLDLLDEIKHFYPSLPVAICTAEPKLKDHVRAMINQGAVVYIDKGDTAPPLDFEIRTDFVESLFAMFGSQIDEHPRTTQSGWFELNDADTTLVFVHGFFSDNVGCWTNKNGSEEVFWPDLVKADPNFESSSLYLAGFHTGPDSGTYSTRDASRDLHAGLLRSTQTQSSMLESSRNILFVCHSTGGVVVRHMLVSNHASFADKKVGLAMYACPSYGSAYAKKFGWLARIYGNVLALELKPGSPFLRELDASFKDLLAQKKIPSLFGVEAIENKPIFSFRWIPSIFGKVVDSESGGRYFGNYVQIAGTDHFSIVKPNDFGHPSHELLYDFFAEHFGTQKDLAKVDTLSKSRKRLKESRH